MLVLPGILYVDDNEPESVSKALGKVVNTVRGPLNNEGYADYMWLNLHQKVVMWERKQIAEALGDLDGVEEQLHRHLGTCEELGLVTQGVCTVDHEGVQVWQMKRGRWERGYLMRGFSGVYQRYLGFKWSLWHECGVYVAEVATEQALVDYLLQAFKASYQEEHTTLKRYTVPHVAQFSKNRHVDNLMRLKGVRIGQANAERLIAEFGTVLNVMQASYTELVGVMGGAWTRQFLDTLGGRDA